MNVISKKKIIENLLIVSNNDTIYFLYKLKMDDIPNKFKIKLINQNLSLKTKTNISKVEFSKKYSKKDFFLELLTINKNEIDTIYNNTSFNGIGNLGDTCFFNGVIQVFIQNKTIMKKMFDIILIKQYMKKQENVEKYKYFKFHKFFNITCFMFFYLLKNNKELNQPEKFKIEIVYTIIKLLQYYFQNKYGGSQHDPFEVYSTIFGLFLEPTIKKLDSEEEKQEYLKLKYIPDTYVNPIYNFEEKPFKFNNTISFDSYESVFFKEYNEINKNLDKLNKIFENTNFDLSENNFVYNKITNFMYFDKDENPDVEKILFKAKYNFVVIPTTLYKNQPTKSIVDMLDSDQKNNLVKITKENLDDLQYYYNNNLEKIGIKDTKNKIIGIKYYYVERPKGTGDHKEGPGIYEYILNKKLININPNKKEKSYYLNIIDNENKYMIPKNYIVDNLSKININTMENLTDTFLISKNKKYGFGYIFFNELQKEDFRYKKEKDNFYIGKKLISTFNYVQKYNIIVYWPEQLFIYINRVDFTNPEIINGFPILKKGDKYNSDILLRIDQNEIYFNLSEVIFTYKAKIQEFDLTQQYTKKIVTNFIKYLETNNNNYKYVLESITYGGSRSGGHITMYSYNQDEKEWYHFDDSSKNKVNNIKDFLQNNNRTRSYFFTKVKKS